MEDKVYGGGSIFRIRSVQELDLGKEESGAGFWFWYSEQILLFCEGWRTAQDLSLSFFFCRLFIDGDRIDAPSVKAHLLLDLGSEPEFRIQVLPYKSILNELKTLCANLLSREKVWVSDKASYAVSEAIPKVGCPAEIPQFCQPAHSLPDPSGMAQRSLGIRAGSGRVPALGVRMDAASLGQVPYAVAILRV